MKTHSQVEELSDSLRQNDDILDPLELMVSISHVVGTVESGTQVQQRCNSFMRAHLVGRYGGGRLVSSNWTDLRFKLRSQLGQLKRLVRLRHGVCLDICDLLSEFDYFPFHFRIPTAFPDSLKVGFNFTVKLQSTTPRASRVGVLDNIASKLYRRLVDNAEKMGHITEGPMAHSPSAVGIRYKLVSPAGASFLPGHHSRRYRRYCRGSCQVPPWQHCVS